MTIYEKKLKRYIALSIIFPVFFVLGIPCIVIPLVKHFIVPLFLPLGCLMVVLGFYGSPLVIIKCASVKRDCAIIKVINSGNIDTVTNLCRHFSLKEPEMLNRINQYITNGVIEGRTFDGEKFTIIKKEVVNNKCPNCGALVTFDGSHKFCQYCGYRIDN